MKVSIDNVGAGNGTRILEMLNAKARAAGLSKTDRARYDAILFGTMVGYFDFEEMTAAAEAALEILHK